jgi:hypothetical protein
LLGARPMRMIGHASLNDETVSGYWGS